MKIRKQRVLLEFELTEQQENVNWNDIIEVLTDLDYWSLDLKEVEDE